MPTTRNLVGFGYLGLVATGAAFVVWFAGIRRLPTAAPPLLGLAAPVTGALLGWVVLDQSLSMIQLAGLPSRSGRSPTARCSAARRRRTDRGLYEQPLEAPSDMAGVLHLPLGR